MFSYLQPVYPEFSEGSSEARWTLCQTHLDFCLSYFHPHSHPAQLLVYAAETCDFPKCREEGGRALKAHHCSIIYSKLQRHKLRNSHISCALTRVIKVLSTLSPYCPCEQNQDGRV